MYKIRFFLVLSFSLILSFGYAQKGSTCPDDMIPQFDKKQNAWGYKNAFGHWVIRPMYTKVSPFVKDRAVVETGGKVGVVNCEGDLVVPVKFEEISHFRHGNAWAKQNGLWGLIGPRGGFVLQPVFTEIVPIPYSELTWAKDKDSLWGLFSEKTRRFMCRPQYPVAKIMSDNSSMVQTQNGNFGVVNHVNCNYLFEPVMERVKKLNAHNIIYLKDEKWGMIGVDGKVLAYPEYDTIAHASPALHLVSKEGSFGLMDKSGTVRLPVEYDSIGEYSDGMFLIIKDNKAGYANLLGAEYIKLQYEEGKKFRNNLAIVKSGGKYGLINRKNETIIAPSYAEIIMSEDGQYFTARDDAGGVFILGPDGNPLNDEAFQDAFPGDSSSFVRVIMDDKTGFYSVNNEDFLFQKSFDHAEPFFKGYALVSSENKWGAVAPSGELVVPMEYDSVEYGKFGSWLVFRTWKDGNLGIIRETGDRVVSNSYQRIVLAEPMYLKVKKNGKWGVTKRNEQVVIEPQYDFISNKEDQPDVPEWPAIVISDGDYGLLTDKGEILKTRYDYIFYMGDKRYAVKNRKGYAVTDSDLSIDPDHDYDSVGYYGDGLAPVYNGRKWGYIDKDTDRHIKYKYEEAYTFSNNSAVVKEDGKYGVINRIGDYIVKPSYTSYKVEDGKEVLMGKDGDELSVYSL